jgi:predicted metal-binding membrane protein
VVRDVLRSRELPVALAGIVALTTLAWLDVWRRAAAMAQDMTTTSGGAQGMSGMNMAMHVPRSIPWYLPDLFAAGIMWTTMMVAMMLPSAMPMLLFFAATRRSRSGRRTIGLAVWLFAAGFLLCWAAWSWLAAGLQWTLQAAVALTPHMAIVRTPLAAAILIVAGVYQFTPLKYRCLSRCQSPLGFLLTGWRSGNWGVLVMGLRYGAYCVGCCWALMALLFVVGIMNLLWIAVLAIFVLVEKTVARGPWPSYAAGVALIAWALYLLVPVSGML